MATQSLPTPSSPVLAALARGRHFSWSTFLVIVLVNTGIAAVYWIEDPRPFWHPLLSVQCDGLAIAYCVNVVAPWNGPRPLPRLILAVLIGATLGHLLTFVLKGYSIDYLQSNQQRLVLSFVAACLNGLFVSLFFLIKFRETRAAEDLHKAEAERHMLSKQAIEAELKLMQAQVEPHFLFNTLASVQFLTETDPPQASRMLGHLLQYLRAALPQLRSSSTTLRQEMELAEAYLNVLKMRMGPRLAFTIDVPRTLRGHPFPPVLLISVVENAVTHGLEPQAAGGTIAIAARHESDRLVVTVTDTGAGLSGETRPGGGVGLSNVRERLAALFGIRGRFTLEDVAPHGARATIEIPFDETLQVTPTAIAAH